MAHHSLSKSLENYYQESGAHSHLCLRSTWLSTPYSRRSAVGTQCSASVQPIKCLHGWAVRVEWCSCGCAALGAALLLIGLSCYMIHSGAVDRSMQRPLSEYTDLSDLWDRTHRQSWTRRRASALRAVLPLQRRAAPGGADVLGGAPAHCSHSANQTMPFVLST